MPVPSKVISDVADVNASIAAAVDAHGSLDASPSATTTSIAMRIDQMVVDVDESLAATGGPLDAGVADAMPAAIVADLIAVFDSASTQLSLADLRGPAGRMALNMTRI